MKSAYIKTIFRTIKNSMGRFMAILAIIALGVGFYSGLVLTEPCFMATAEDFIDDYKLYDLRLISTIGFNDEDIANIQNIRGVDSVEGAYFTDALTNIRSGNSEDAVGVCRIHSITNEVNTLKVVDGRLPENSREIVIDGYNFGSDQLGKTIVIADENTDDTFDSLNDTEYTIVGIIRSPYYMNFQRGTTNVGNGSISYYAYVMPEAFTAEYYSEVYVYCDERAKSYSDNYDQLVDTISNQYEDELQVIIEDRFNDTIGDAYDEYNDAYAEFIEERDNASAELEDARIQLEDARQELADAWAELVDAEIELSDGESELYNARHELSEAEALLNDKEDELNRAQIEVDNNRITAINTRTELVAQLDTVNATIAELESAIPQLQAGIDQINQGLPFITDPDTLAAMEAQLTELSTNLAMAQAGLAQAQAGKIQLEAGIAQVDDGLAQLDAAQAQIDDGRTQIADGRAQIASGRNEINTHTTELSDGWESYEDGLAQYEDGLAEYLDGVREYNDGLREYQDEISHAYRELGVASKLIYDATHDVDINTYVLDRDTNVGYVCFESDSQIVSGVAKVFPVFFFAIAALVCSTTMQRMVNDERTHIGTMKAMGYSGFSIIMKYVIYAGLASVIGCTLGYLGGIKLFPYVIWDVYGMMYGFAPVTFVSSLPVFILAMVVSLACSVGVTVITALGELKGMPAELIRPKAPTAGKRILLERVTFIWERLGFLIKISARNVFRFKKRMLMMIVGIAGCSALLVTAFGIRNSISDIVGIQYEKILTYNLSVTFEDDASADEIMASIEDTNDMLGVDTVSVLANMSPIKHNGEDAIRDVYLIASDDPNILEATHIVVDGEEMPWPEDNMIAITRKLADKNGLSVGDMITFEYGDSGETFTLQIQYVCDNYIYHYAFMNANTYEMMMGETYSPTTALIIRKGDNSADATGVSDADYGAKLANNGPVKSWSVVSDSIASFTETMSKLDAVVILIIGCSGALAFIVLFNLNNINITERIREIATLKVLGFNRRETGAYVFRENFILVFMGYVVGAPLGVALNSFVIAQIEMDMVTFIVKVLPISFVYALLFVVAFSLIVNAIIRIKIERIDMAESLKSIE